MIIIKKLNPKWTKNGYTMRLGKAEESEKYYDEFISKLDLESIRMTGSRTDFRKEEVVEFYIKSVNEDDRYDFIIINPEGEIIGESVINEIDFELKSAHFRIGISSSNNRGKGIGTWAIEETVNFAFGDLKLHRLSLEVFSFNERTKKVYLKAGFKIEGVLRDSILDEGKYADIIAMAILEDEWRSLENK